MKALDVVRRRMGNSGLVGTPLGSPEEVVRRLGAMQAQDYGPAKWAIGRRAKGMVDADVDRALVEGSIVRTHVLRPTWHFVAREDVRWLLALTGPRIRKGLGPRWRELGLDVGTLHRAGTTLARALQGGGRLTRKGVVETLQAARIDTSGQRLAHILIHCELDAVICSGGLEGKQQTYALLDERVPGGPELGPDDALVELVRRYLAGHGPATVADLRWWSSLTVAGIRRGLELLGDEVAAETVDGIELWSMGADERSKRFRGAQLLHVYDELLVGYSDTRYFGDPRAADARAAWVNRELPMGVVLRSGLVAGHWRRTVEPGAVVIEVLLYDTPTPTVEREIRSEATRLGRFLDRRAKLTLGRV
jgi:hypothetical protein